MATTPLKGVDATATATDALATVDYISRLLTTSRFDLDQLLQQAVQTTAERMNLMASAVRLLNPKTGELELKAVFGLSEAFVSGGPKYGLASRFQRLIANGGVLEVDDIRDEPDLLFNEALLREGVRSLLAVGLHSDGEFIGSLSVYTRSQYQFTSEQIDAIRTIANHVSVAIELARLFESEREKELMEHDLEVAADIQKRALPSVAPEVDGFRFASRYTSWHQVGGDFYDFIELPKGNIGLAVGDVSGKGIRAAVLALAARSTLRAHAEYEYSISQVLERVNRSLCKDTEPEQFVTLSYGVLNTNNRVFTFATALCPPPIVVRNGEVIELDTNGLPFGILDDQEYDQGLIQLEPGDLLVMYSDGYSEIFNDEGDMFGEDTVQSTILAHAHLSPDEMLSAVDAEVEAFIGGSMQGDDRTVIAVALD